jgi:hypothetical protein
VASGGLFIGNATSTSGFAFDGTLEVGANQVVLDDANTAQLGVSTTLGGGGRLTSFNGITLAGGRSVTASASASASISGNFVNNGTVTGPTAAGQVLTLNNNVSGIGTYQGNVRFVTGFAPGINGPAAVMLSSFTLSETATLSLEIGGVIPGTHHDRMNFTGIGALDGALNVTLISGFQPVEGNSFTLLNGGTLTGSFDLMNFPSLAPGLAWSYLQSGSAATLVVIPESSVALSVLFVMAGFACRRRRITS